MVRLCLLFCLLILPAITLTAQDDDAPGLELVQRIGRGNPQHIEWQPNGDLLLVDTVIGAWLYTAELEDVAHIEAARLGRFSPDGTQIAGVNNDQTVTLWDATTFEQTATISGHDAYVIDLAWSPNGNYIATLDNMGQLTVHQTDGTVHMQEIADGAQTIHWSPDSRSLVLSLDVEGYVFFGVEYFNRTEYRITSSAYTPSLSHRIQWINERRFAYMVLDESATVYGVSGGSIYYSTDIGSAYHYTLADEGRYTAYFAIGGLQLSDNVREETITIELSWGGSSIEVDPAATQIAFGYRRFHRYEPAKIALVDLDTFEFRTDFVAHRASVENLAWNNDGTLLASVGYFNDIKIWRTDTDEPELLAQNDIHVEVGPFVSWQPDSSLLAVPDADSSFSLWDIDIGERLATFEGHTDTIAQFAWNPAQSTVATTAGRPNRSSGYDTTDDTTVRIWHLEDDEITRIEGQIVTAIAWRSDGSQLAILSALGELLVWDDTTQAIVNRIDFSEHGINERSGNSVFWVNEESDIIMATWSPRGGYWWSLQTGTRFGPNDIVGSITSESIYWDRGDYIGAEPPYDVSHVVTTRDAENLETQTTTLLESEIPFIDGATSPDNSAGYAINAEHELIVWSLPDGAERFRLQGVSSVQWSATGTQLATIDDKQRPQIIDALTGDTIGQLDWQVGTGEGIYDYAYPSLFWSDDDRYIAHVTEGVVYIWRVRPS